MVLVGGASLAITVTEMPICSNQLNCWWAIAREEISEGEDLVAKHTLLSKNTKQKLISPGHFRVCHLSGSKLHCTSCHTYLEATNFSLLPSFQRYNSPTSLLSLYSLRICLWLEGWQRISLWFVGQKYCYWPDKPQFHQVIMLHTKWCHSKVLAWPQVSSVCENSLCCCIKTSGLSCPLPVARGCKLVLSWCRF